MSKHITDLNNFFESYFHELRAMSDDDVLDGEAAQTVKARALERLKAAKAEAGRRRLAMARANMRDTVTYRAEGGEDITPAAARAYVARAANDARYTMAARKLDEMTDEDILRLYRQLRMLESDSEADDKP
jgi:hypothetical protein